ncbi:hypothetical protein [Paraburkholderia sp. A3RO-2L]|uniref:hypothetical protein n=1 Tax=Paraburkholderia sp. A3RO-2L TaxID=3028376 RepID=UPI003DA7C425
MREIPILFSGPMVRAILDGSKTQTRRIVKPAGAHHIFQFRGKDEARGADEPTGEWAWCRSAHVVSEHIRCPYGKPGDRLWVRETWQGPMWEEGTWDADTDYHTPKYCEYRADGGPTPEYVDFEDNLRQGWKPSIHMPRWASRITLEVSGVRIERLQSISEADAEAEGIEGGHATVQFRGLWDSVALRGADWDANPWVWVVEFKRIGGVA